MNSPIVKRSIVIAGHKTSVSLEEAFTLSDLVATIDTDRHHGNLSSAIRLFVLDHYREQARKAPQRGILRSAGAAASALRADC